MAQIAATASGERSESARAPVRNRRALRQAQSRAELGAAALPHAPTTRRRKRRRRSSRLPASRSRCRTARKSVRPVSSSSRRPSPKTPPRTRRPACRVSRGSRRRIASPVAEMPRRVSASSSPARGGFGPKCHEIKNGRPSWTPLESTTNDSRSLSTSEPGYLAALTRRSDYRKNRAAGGVTVLASPRLGAPAPRRPTHGAARAVLLLLAAGRGSEQGRRWAAPVVLRSLAARSASASGWAAGGGHAGLNGPREERRASALLPFAKHSPTSRRSAALFPPAFGGLRVGARAFSVSCTRYCVLWYKDVFS